MAYIDEWPGDDGRPRYASCAVDSSCSLTPSTLRRYPQFRVELPGHPILGDGKSDNQNHAIIFSRGTIIQAIDANQDGYIEESLKLPCALHEFKARRPPPPAPRHAPFHRVTRNVRRCLRRVESRSTRRRRSWALASTSFRVWAASAPLPPRRSACLEAWCSGPWRRRLARATTMVTQT